MATHSPLYRALLAGILALGSMTAAADCSKEERVHVRLVTDRGPIELALNQARAPKTVANFLRYAREDFYAGTIFHRVIPGFMIQGGGLTRDLERKETHAPVENESANGLSNERGSVAMARTRDPDSATAQFFINLTDNARLDGQSGQPGYTVFGQVVDGMDTVDAIAAVATTAQGGRRNVPREPIVIEAVEIETAACTGDTEASDGGDA